MKECCFASFWTIKTGASSPFRFQNPFCHKSLLVRVVEEGDMTISFYSSQEEDEDNMLCVLEIVLPPKSDVSDVKILFQVKERRKPFTLLPKQ